MVQDLCLFSCLLNLYFPPLSTYLETAVAAVSFYPEKTIVGKPRSRHFQLRRNVPRGNRGTSHRFLATLDLQKNTFVPFSNPNHPQYDGGPIDKNYHQAQEGARNGALLFHVAPMQCYTNRHLRWLLRLLSTKAVLWTEMEKVEDLLASDAARNRRLRHDDIERPLVLQLGGGDPVLLAAAARLALRCFPHPSVTLLTLRLLDPENSANHLSPAHLRRGMRDGMMR